MFKKLDNLYETIKNETDPGRKKLLEEYNDELIAFGEFIVLTGGVATELPKNKYLKKVQLASKELANNYNATGIQEFKSKIDEVYDQWIKKLRMLKSRII